MFASVNIYYSFIDTLCVEEEGKETLEHKNRNHLRFLLYLCIYYFFLFSLFCCNTHLSMLILQKVEKSYAN